MSREKAAELIGKIEDLPTLPEVVIEITRLVENPDTTAEDIYRIVSTDVSLAATMLKLVNSAFYGVARSVTSLEKAIRILGFSTVRNIALAAFVFDSFMSGKGKLDYRGFWFHSIAAAAGCDVMAKRLRVKDPGEYYVYGLLHDLGVVVMMQYLPGELARIKDAVASGKDLRAAELEVVGCTHNELGAAAAEHWDFPPTVVAVMAHHCSGAGEAQYRREIGVASCADALVQALEVGSGAEARVPVVEAADWEAAGVTADQIGGIMDELLAELEHSRGFIELLFR